MKIKNNKTHSREGRKRTIGNTLQRWFLHSCYFCGKWLVQCATKIKHLKFFEFQKWHKLAAAVIIPVIHDFPVFADVRASLPSIQYRCLQQKPTKLWHNMSAYSEDKQGQKFINFPRRVTRFCGKTKMRASTTIFTQRPAEKAEDQYLSEIKHARSSLCIEVKFFFFFGGTLHACIY